MTIAERTLDFLPSRNGLHFANCFAPVAYDARLLGRQVSWGKANQGVCGGMIYAVRDLYQAGQLPPPDSQPPTAGEPFRYLCQRLLESFDLPFGPLRYYTLMAPGLRIGEKHWLRSNENDVMLRREWPRVRRDLDEGYLSPLGLVLTRSWKPRDLAKNHQVLAYGYRLDAQQLVLRVYDPNWPDDDQVRLTLLLDGQSGVDYSNSNGKVADAICFFRTRYRFKQPRGLAC